MEIEHDTALVVAARGGDLRARDELVAAWLPLIYNIVGRALDGHADVDDVVQETMVDALTGLGGLRDPERFRSWLVAIAINRIRRRHARRAFTAPLDEVVGHADPGSDFANLTILRLGLSGQRRDVATATGWLDPDTRELLALWWLEAAGTLTRAELAAALDLPATHAAVRVQRMKEQLEAARVVVRALAVTPRCAALSALLADWNGSPTPLWRKRVTRHARTCRACGDHRRGLAPVEGLLAGLALLPPTVTLWHLCTGAGTATATAGAMGPAGATSAGGVVGPGGTLGAAGSGGATDPGGASSAGSGPGGGAAAHADLRPARRLRHTATIAAVALVLVVPAAVVLLDRPHHDTPVRGAVGPTPVAATPPPPPPSPLPATTPPPSPSTEPPTAATPPPTTRSTAPVDTRARLERAVVDLVNAARAEHGCAPVRVDDRLRTAARKHSDDMATRRFYDHVDPDGVHADARIAAAGYRWRLWGENLNRGRADAAHIVDEWLGSPVHRANILDCGFTDLGVGVTVGPGGTTFWTQLFAAPA
ncbi:sigma-70 family RNA polymerase sigma factor [Embleya sp. NPDC056575]|uniref:sigma-70 family RNA polymerase sigma factor n=1 Tax=unclassified Embleya TaxID=2699296 RepID=UPI003681F6CA